MNAAESHEIAEVTSRSYADRYSGTLGYLKSDEIGNHLGCCLRKNDRCWYLVRYNYTVST
jgi:hypothetical protein